MLHFSEYIIMLDDTNYGVQILDKLENLGQNVQDPRIHGTESWKYLGLTSKNTWKVGDEDYVDHNEFMYCDNIVSPEKFLKILTKPKINLHLRKLS